MWLIKRWILKRLSKNVYHMKAKGDKSNSALLNFSQIKVLAEIRNNPNITKPQLMVKCNLGKTSIDNTIKILKNKGYIKRIGSNKTGSWEVLK